MKCFDELLAPFDTQRFFREHWGRGSLHVRGRLDKFVHLPGLEQIPSIMAGKLSAERWQEGYGGITEASFIDQHGKLRELKAPPSMWSELYNAGVSLCFGPMTPLSDVLMSLVEEFRKSTPCPGRIKTTCYLTPPSSGSVMHFDRQHVFFLQVSGEKHWRYGSRSALVDSPIFLPLPLLDAPEIKPLGVAAPAETGLAEAVLRPGDLLYLPPGVWHEGRTQDRHSLHFTLTFDPHNPMSLVTAFLRKAMLETPSLRRDVRYAQQSDGGSPLEIVAAALEDVRTALAQVTPAELVRCFEETNQSASEPLRVFFNQL